MSKSLIKPGSASLRFWQLLLLVVILGVWHLASRDPKVAFFFGEPLKVWGPSGRGSSPTPTSTRICG